MNQKEYNNKINRLSKIMSLESKVNIVGSAKIKRSIYHSDYDNYETVRGKNENMIYNHFRSVFELIKTSNNTVITDFKLGEFRGKPLRWDYEDIKNRSNNGMSFDMALKQKSMIKMDIVTLLNGRFTEISEVYNIFLDGESNFNYTKDNIRKELIKDMKEQIKDGNYMKSLKRKFSLLKLDDKNKEVRDHLIDYFNSPIGLINRAKSDLETMLLVIEHNKFDIDEVRESLQMLKEQVSAFPVENNLEMISNMKSKTLMSQPIYKQILRLKEYINSDAKNVLIRYN